METALSYLDDKVMHISTDEQKWKNRLIKMAAQHPDEMTITRRPEENDGCLCCKCPSSWLKISPPVRRSFTEDQLDAMKERLKYARKNAQVVGV